MKLFIYDHCPYCVRAWMPLGIKNIPCELVVMLNDDVETPTAMIGKKMVPILELDDGTYIPESLDIVAYLDENFGESATFAPFSKRADLAAWVDQFKGTMNDLCLPRVPQAPLKEFATASAREYFTPRQDCLHRRFRSLDGRDTCATADHERGLATVRQLTARRVRERDPELR